MYRSDDELSLGELEYLAQLTARNLSGQEGRTLVELIEQGIKAVGYPEQQAVLGRLLEFAKHKKLDGEYRIALDNFLTGFFVGKARNFLSHPEQIQQLMDMMVSIASFLPSQTIFNISGWKGSPSDHLTLRFAMKAALLLARSEVGSNEELVCLTTLFDLLDAGVEIDFGGETFGQFVRRMATQSFEANRSWGSQATTAFISERLKEPWQERQNRSYERFLSDAISDQADLSPSARKSKALAMLLVWLDASVVNYPDLRQAQEAVRRHASHQPRSSLRELALTNSRLETFSIARTQLLKTPVQSGLLIDIMNVIAIYLPDDAHLTLDSIDASLTVHVAAVRPQPWLQAGIE
ncbi:MAG: hypothetical protein FWG16_05620 [Micrococcales bacterium]|nr:hypothetical protein [Micrococcales bacterium]